MNEVVEQEKKLVICKIADILSGIVREVIDQAPAEMDDETVILAILPFWPELRPEDYARLKLLMVATGLVNATDTGVWAAKRAQA